MSIVEIHGWLGKAALVYFLALAIWGLARFARRQGVSEGYWWGLVIAELLILAQGGLGAYLWYSGLRPARDMHVIYGFVGGVAIPAIYVSSKGRERRAEVLAYGVTTLVIAGLTLQAIVTAG
jgi:CDP-diglyceride synthetase